MIPDASVSVLGFAWLAEGDVDVIFHSGDCARMASEGCDESERHLCWSRCVWRVFGARVRLCRQVAGVILFGWLVQFAGMMLAAVGNCNCTLIDRVAQQQQGLCRQGMRVCGVVQGLRNGLLGFVLGRERNGHGDWIPLCAVFDVLEHAAVM